MQTPADYTLVVRNPPAHVVDPDAYRAFFAGQWQDDIVAVTMGGGPRPTLLPRRAARGGFSGRYTNTYGNSSTGVEPCLRFWSRYKLTPRESGSS